MLQLLWLLLPVAAATGWWAGRRSARKNESLRASPGQFSGSEYFRGLNYLLNEQQDEAIEVFIRLVEVDSETIETHLALGNLFRRRGEVDRAIRIHQHLIARPNLSRDQRADALLELARDYMRAGVLDRAEGLFNELVRSRMHLAEASRQLLTIYESEREWQAAIDTARRLQRVSNRPMGVRIAHYYCELADEEYRRGGSKGAARLLGRALSADPACVRASILEGRLAMDAGNFRRAIRAWRRVEQQDAAFLPEVIEPLFDAMRRSEHASVLNAYLDRLRARYNSFSVIRAATRMIRDQEGDQAARAFFREQVARRPSLRGLREWVEMELEHTPESNRPSAEIILGMLDQLLESKPVYQCSQCGHQGRVLNWQCPSCRNWNTVKPIIGIEGE